MDKVTHYRQILKKIIHQHSQYSPSGQDCETLAITDDTSDNYLLIDVGWYESRRVHSVILHCRIVEEKIYVEWDGLESGISKDLLKEGISETDIVLGFIRPQRRNLIDFSVM